MGTPQTPPGAAPWTRSEDVHPPGAAPWTRALGGPPGQGLTGDELSDIEEHAVQWVQEAGQRALESFRRPLLVEYKKNNRSDPVTETDRAVEGFLREAIAKAYPEHLVLGEEGEELLAAQPDFLWVLDPVDGTTNFVNGLPLFACSAALLYRGEPVVGALFLPVAPRPLFREAPGSEGLAQTPTAVIGSAVLHARAGGGAFLDDMPVQTSDSAEPENSALVGFPGHHDRLFARRDSLRRKPGELRGLGSMCYEIGMVGCGVFQYAIFRAPRLWDVAAGMLIVREAGGLALRWRNGRWEPLTRFDPMANPGKKSETGLRYWTSITLVGGKLVAPFVAERLRPQNSLRRWVRTVIAHLVPSRQQPKAPAHR